jgi:small subunit ribosomal protein S11
MAEDVQTTTPVAETEQTQAAAEQAVEAKPAPKRKKAKRSVSHGQIHVMATFNNTIITVTDSKGNTLATASAGALGFRGSKKGTAYAAQVAAEKAVQTAKQNHGLSKADVFVKGIGQGRDAAVRTLINERIQVDTIRDVTGIPHGGTRPRKQRRT